MLRFNYLGGRIQWFSSHISSVLAARGGKWYLSLLDQYTLRRNNGWILEDSIYLLHWMLSDYDLYAYIDPQHNLVYT